jgi:hypothetical protein
MKSKETPRKTDRDDRTQRQKFIDAAQEHGADGDEGAFRNAVRKIATASIGKAKKVAAQPKVKKGPDIER